MKWIVAALIVVATPAHAFMRDGVENDKELHFGVSLALSVMAMGVLRANDEPRGKAALYGFTFAMLAGVMKELHDAGQPNNKFDKNDLLADALGAGAGVMIGWTF